MDFNKNEMKKGFTSYLLAYTIISCSLLSCKLVNAPYYLSCYENSKVSTRPIDDAFYMLWLNQPKNRLDFETLLSIVYFNPRLIKDGDSLLSLGAGTNELTRRQIEEKYFKDQDLNLNGQITYYWYFKGLDQTRIYVIKSMDCSRDKPNNTKREIIEACSFCLMSVMYLPINDSSTWKSYFDMSSAERKENNRLFRQDIIQALE